MKLVSGFRLVLIASALALPACGGGEDVDATSGGNPGGMGAGTVEEMGDGLGAQPTGGTAGPAAAGAGSTGSVDPSAAAGSAAGSAGASIDTTARTAP